MGERWFENKYVNPRTAEGEPQVERLGYARELFESFGETDQRFSGAAIVGSTMKGYGIDDESDIDVALFFKEVPKREWMPASDGPLVATPAGWVQKHTFHKDFLDFKKEFDAKRTEAGKRIFEIDRNAGGGDLNHNFKTTILGNTKMLPKEMLSRPILFYELSYPTISSKNPDALMPIEEIIQAMRLAVKKATDKEKEILSSEILGRCTELFDAEYRTYSKRTSLTVGKDDYIAARITMLKRQMKSKFGLEVTK